MHTCQEIIEWFNRRWPEALACDWDNVGLLAGSREKTVKKVYVALDATEAVVDTAVEAGADLLITHHPMIFRAVKKINEDDPVGRKLLKLIRADVSYYAAHTSFDIAKGGMADLAMEQLDIFSDAVPLEVTGEEEGKPVGIGKVGNLKAPVALEDLAELVKERFRVPAVTLYCGDRKKKVSRAAISPGSGKSMMGAAVTEKAEVLITGDMGHHEGLDLKEAGVALIDAGHYGLEHIFVEKVAKSLEEAGFGVEVVKAPLAYPCEVI